jgi:hypothetical protein
MMSGDDKVTIYYYILDERSSLLAKISSEHPHIIMRIELPSAFVKYLCEQTAKFSSQLNKNKWGLIGSSPQTLIDYLGYLIVRYVTLNVSSLLMNESHGN